MMKNSNDMIMGTGMFLYWIIGLLVIIGIIYFFRKKSNVLIPFQKNESSLDLLEKRLANEEISIEEFEKTKKLIQKNNKTWS